MKCLDCGTEMEQGTVVKAMHKVDHTHMNLRLIKKNRKKKKTGIKRIFFQKNCYCFCNIQQNNVHGIVRIVKSIDVDGC